MKIPHKNHGWLAPPEDSEWSERVEREAEQHTHRTEVAWLKARRRLARAIEKADAAEVRPEVTPAKKRRLWEIVDARREELRRIEHLMQSSPAGSQHRGKGSHRGVTTGDAL